MPPSIFPWPGEEQTITPTMSNQRGERSVMSLLKTALYYKKNLGYSVIPVGWTKKPLIEWKEFQKRLPTDEEIIKWWTQTPEANIGVVTGKISGVIVIDLDSEEAIAEIQKLIKILPLTVRSRTPRGMHLWFMWPGFEVENRAGFLPGCDLRGDAAPLLHRPHHGGLRGGEP